MLQRVRDLKVQYRQRHPGRRPTRPRSRAEVLEIAKEVNDDRDRHEVQRHVAVRQASFTFQVGANDGRDDLRRRRQPRRRHRRSASTGGLHEFTAARPALPRAMSTALSTRRARRPLDIDKTIENVSKRAWQLRRGAEPSRAPSGQPGDLPGEPDGVRVAYPRRGHGCGDDQVHEARTSCSRPARACSRRPTRPRRASSRCSAKHSRAADASLSGPSGRLTAFNSHVSQVALRATDGEDVESVPTLIVVPARAENAEEIEPILQTLVSVTATAPDAMVLVVDDRSPGAAGADDRGRVRRARLRLRPPAGRRGRLRRLQRRPLGRRRARHGRLPRRVRAWCSTPPAGSTACAPAPAPTANPPRSPAAPSCDAARHDPPGRLLLLALPPRVARAPAQRARGAARRRPAAAVPGRQRAAVRPQRVDRAASASTTSC